ncbi:MAG: TerB family tellurite resistance protein [Thalassotalea sp.]
MITKIKRFFTELADSTQPNTSNELSIEMASTVLLCEVMRADGKLDDEEIKLLSEQINHSFGLTQDEIAQLIQQAISTSEHATDFYRFTSKINQHYTINEKIEMVKHLWQLALADGEISAIEEHTIRKIADLLHLRQSEYIQAKDIIIKR